MKTLSGQPVIQLYLCWARGGESKKEGWREEEGAYISPPLRLMSGSAPVFNLLQPFLFWNQQVMPQPDNPLPCLDIMAELLFLSFAWLGISPKIVQNMLIPPPSLPPGFEGMLYCRVWATNVAHYAVFSFRWISRKKLQILRQRENAYMHYCLPNMPVGARRIWNTAINKKALLLVSHD